MGIHPAFPLLGLVCLLTAAPLAAQQVEGDTAEHLREIASHTPADAVRGALRAATANAVTASQALGLAPLAVVDNLLDVGYPLAWVVEETTFRYGSEQLADVVSLVVFLHGQSIKDLLRDAIREGARRRAVEIARVRRLVKAAGADRAAAIAALSPEDRVILGWEPVDWSLVGLSEQAIDLRFLEFNDDPGGYASAQ